MMLRSLSDSCLHCLAWRKYQSTLGFVALVVIMFILLYFRCPAFGPSAASDPILSKTIVAWPGLSTSIIPIHAGKKPLIQADLRRLFNRLKAEFRVVVS